MTPPAGDAPPVSYEEFVDRAWGSLYRTAFLLSGDHHRAEDAVQTALMKVFLAWPRVASMQHPEAYTRRIVVNQLTSWWRRRSNREFPAIVLVEPVLQAFDEEVAEAATVWSSVLELPPRQRAVVVLRYYEDRSEAEIAELLGISRGSVKTHAHHALRSLRSRWGDDAEDGRAEP